LLPADHKGIRKELETKSTPGLFGSKAGSFFVYQKRREVAGMNLATKSRWLHDLPTHMIKE
jgi:hypothetical protein